MRYDWFQESFFRFFHDEFSLPQDKQTTKRVADLRSSLDAGSQQLKMARNRLQRVMSSFADADNDEIRAQADAMIRKLTNEINGLKQQIETDNQQLVELTAYADNLHDYVNHIKKWTWSDLQDQSIRIKFRDRIREIVSKIILFARDKKPFYRIQLVGSTLGREIYPSGYFTTPMID